MLKYIVLPIIFSLLINWVVSLQMLNQSTKEKNIKTVSLSLAIFIGFIAGLLLSINL
jgi:predicted histidine transporter YuiF (NhaC family)